MIELEKKRITTSPQIHRPESTTTVMWSVAACLVPAAVWGIYVFGLRALVVILVSIGASVLCELSLGLVLKRNTIADGSAVLTGLLIGFNLPPDIPLYIPIAASVFAIGVVKWTFGGLGSNWMNPALAGRVFVFFSWTGPMTTWKSPGTLVDAVTAATPLSTVKSGLFSYSGSAAGPMEYLQETGFPGTSADTGITDFLRKILEPLGAQIEPGYGDLLLGNISGCIGEVSAILLILGSVYLFIRKIITWHIPVSFLGTFGILVWIFGGGQFGSGGFSGNVVFHLLTGGLILGAFYMATDMVTSPLTAKGMIIFGCGIGFFTFLIRFFGSFPEGVSLAIILMNIFVPAIDRYTGPKRFGVNQKDNDDE
ncbi:MAG: RnfABCDGE type electron transport complex subunit D [Spirochaetales bacterium]|jgi:Na+-translocating ferredoxin:NAD+ oxidoreductase subunit D|nr:RnfABCDGE type electron transport complex subunit D [Spirochaetales bacterium]